MAVVRKVKCQVSGKSYTLNSDNYTSKIEEYGGEEDNLKKYFLTKKVKAFLERGYSVQEIRNILNTDTSDLYDSESREMEELITFHKIKNNTTSKKVASSLNFATHKSDPDVLEFINNIRNYE
jgi:hypothetical protein